MRIVGTRDRNEIELNPIEAYRRARKLDRLLAGARPPVARGVSRGTHAYFNRLDDERQVMIARKLNTA